MKRLKKRLFIKRWSTMNDTPCAFSLLNNEKLIQYSLNLQVNALILISVSTIFIYQMLHNNILKHRIKGRKFLKMLIAIYICFIKSEFFLVKLRYVEEADILWHDHRGVGRSHIHVYTPHQIVDMCRQHDNDTHNIH